LETIRDIDEGVFEILEELFRLLDTHIGDDAFFLERSLRNRRWLLIIEYVGLYLESSPEQYTEPFHLVIHLAIIYSREE
jgi:hypothetical protein